MRTSRGIVLATEVGLVLVTMSVVLGMARLFAGGGWLGPLTLSAVAAHGVAAVLRRRGMSLPVTAGVMALAAVLVVSWISYWSTTAVGVPTGDTWSMMGDDLADAWTLYKDVSAPAPAEPGFVLASSLAVWVIAYIADWAAFRLWVPFEATLPAGTLFLFTSLLGTPRGRGWAVAIYAASVIAFLLLHRVVRQDGSSHWVADRRAIGQRSLLTVGTALGVVAVLVGTVMSPSLPGADSPGVLDPRSLRDDDEGRRTISPLVDIRTRLVEQANVEVFQVRSAQPSYWRLTSLERFDGTLWSSSGRFGEADGELPTAVDAEVRSEPIEQSFTIKALAAIWLPAAYEPRSFDGEGVQVRYDEDSATLIVDNDVPSSDGLVYEVRSSSPRLTPEDLAGTAGEVPGEIRDRYLGLPDDFSPRARALAEEITAGATTPDQQARAIQDHLRTFEYDLGIGPGHGGDALEQFLFETRRGYCEQFAGSFAALARAVGLPARVAVGFTQGESDPADPTLYRVRGEHAHAWPEVYLAGAGWVPFEPTPGRGMPFAESYTGVAPAQAATSDPSSATTSPPTTQAPGGPATPPSDGPVRDPELGLDTGGGAPAPTESEGEASLVERYLLRPVATALPVAAALLVSYLVLVPATLRGRRWLRRQRTESPGDRIAVAWAESVEDASVVGYREHSSDTFQERARRLGATLPEAANHAWHLARRMEVSSYAPGGADDDDADTAVEAAAGIAAAARATAPLTARVRRWLDPRPLVATWQVQRKAAQRRITTTARADLESERELVP